MHAINHRTALACALAIAESTAEAADNQIYAKLGLPGIVVGYARPLSQTVTVRADFGTTGTLSRSEKQEQIEYQGKLKYGRAAVLGDYFVFGGGFRLTGGLTANETSLTLDARTTPGSTLTVNGKTVVLEGGGPVQSQGSVS